MLKMVVSDLDGTLINGQEKLSPKVFDTIKTLNQNGIYFAVASGRKICQLKKIFSFLKDDIIFIACDGAFVSYKDNILLKEVIDKKIISDVFERNGIPFENISDSSGDTVKIIVKKEDMPERIDEYIRINHLLTCVYDDFGIKEYVKFGKNKGTALKQVLDLLSISKNDAIVFGDNYNDIEMLKLIPKSFAMVNGKSEVKRICRYSSTDFCQSVIEFLENQGGVNCEQVQNL